MDARQPAELPQPVEYDEAAWNALVKHLESEFGDSVAAERKPAAGTNAVDLVLQCLMDSYRALFGLW
ncbi:hypothetical protein AB0J55_41715 [Amycolatopsis sp. NPDC049688]|uniref:hypothetical protein n=1 Tax=Amycolatopsis sp. NPDC049688 TaxID=3154733 RepID=UPI00343F0425